MTFVDDAKISGAEPVYVVTIIVPRCGRSYGLGDCTAQIGVTGERKCFNTRVTCQDPANFLPRPSSYVFIEPISEIPDIVGLPSEVTNQTIGVFPFLSGPPRFSASELDPGGGFGVRASCNFALSDSAHHDIGVDRYVEERDYDPFEVGTFFGKWLARNPYYIGSRVQVSLGHIVDGVLNLSNAQNLSYFVESIDGPDSNGSVRVKCKDVLKLADNARAQCPAPSSGVLIDDLDEDQTQFFVAPPEALIEYPGAGIFKVRIGDEVMQCTRSADQFTVVRDDGIEDIRGRSIDGTELSDHDKDSTVQLVKEFAPSTVPDILTELLTDFADIDPSFIDASQWSDTQQRIGFLFSGQISEPEGIKDLCEQLLKSSGSFIYYDERSQTLKLGSIIPTPEIETLPLLNDEETFIEDSVSVSRKDDKRLSQVWYHRGLINSTEALDDPVNYKNRLISADIEAETDDLYGQKKIDRVWARWTPRENAAAAFTVAGRRLNRFKKTPRMVTFSADTKDAGIWQADLVALRHRNLQAPTGEELPVPFQILRVSHSGHAKVEYTALEYDVDPVGEFGGLDTIIIDQDTTGADILDIYQTTIGNPDDAGEIVTVIVLEGVNVRGMVGGGFPESSIRLINRGNVAGLAGSGGRGGAALSDGETTQAFPGAAGGDGGDAIVMSEDWEIVNLGNIYGGSGGGGGGGAAASSSPIEAAGGGGGGSGRDLISVDGGAGGSPNGNPGEAGDEDAAGTGGATTADGSSKSGKGGDGGDWASSGTAGASSTGDVTASGGAAGSGGRAIVTNGFSLTLQDDGTIIGAVD